MAAGWRSAAAAWCCWMASRSTPVHARSALPPVDASRRSKGLGTTEQPHPLQQAFLDEQAGQCGYCLSGIIMQREGAARPHSVADARPRLRAALDKNLCRCGAHPRILRAVEKAAAMLREGKAA